MTLVKHSVRPKLGYFFDDFLSQDLFNWNNNNYSSTNTNLPAVNILEQEDSYIVEMAAPGMTKEDFHIEMKNNLLTIRSENSNNNELSENQRYALREFSYQSFHRSFELNKKVVDDSNIQANYSDGILRIVLPKTAEAKPKPPRMIEVH